MKGFQTETIFILDSENAFKMAERFKTKLENKGFKVLSIPYGTNGIRISGGI